LVSFELSEEQTAIRDVIAEFARDHIRPAARPADETGQVPLALIKAAEQLRLTAGWIPEQYGGDGTPRSALTGALIAEELAWGDLALALHLGAPRLAVFPLLEWGSEEQRKISLTRFADGGFVPAGLAVIEPRYDFDPLTMRTSAHRDGSEWVISGAKCLVPLAAESEEILVCAALEGRPGLGSVGAFMIPRNTAGVWISERERNMGIKALSTYSVRFENCRLGADRQLGGSDSFDFARLCAQMRIAMVAMAAGVARGAFEYSRDYAKDRKAFGAAIATRQAIAFMIADMAIEVEAMRLLAWEAAWRLDRGESAFNEASLARNYAADAVLKVTDNAVQVLGGHGYVREHPVEMWLRNGRGFSVFDSLAIV
jgi:alkylation response protein AidB-like acyl-CoA dehydrogenase